MKPKHLTCAAVLLASTAFAGTASADRIRLATVPVGAEITGMYLNEEGDFFFNVQHPATAITGPYNKATVGVVAGVDFNSLAGQFSSVPAPASDFAKQTVQTALGEYQVLAQQGDFSDRIKGGLGAIVAADGTVLKSSNDPDFNAFVPTGENRGYLFTNWEDRPGGMSRMRIAKGADGRWSVDPEDVMMIDFSGVGGTWVNCFGSVSPWGTPLTSEELYFDNTENWIDPAGGDDFEDAEKTRAYLGGPSNPYDYGWIVEITDPIGDPTPVKHFAMGRYSHENSVVMPDRKTAYLSDDGTDVVFFKFVADEAGDLSAGTLYAAKATQRAPAGSDAATTAFAIDWIELAHGTDAQIMGWIDSYDGLTVDDHTDGAEYVSDREIAEWAAGKAADDRAAFLESRKAAAAKGATAEFRRMEGVMGNREAIESGAAPFLYMAMSEVAKGMSDDSGDVQVSENPCGVVYQLPLDENYDISRMIPVVAGHGYDRNNTPNACPLDSIANPDNIIVLDDGRVVIGEDTGLHENNMIWIWTPPQS